jgi:hypothetical protein
MDQRERRLKTEQALERIEHAWYAALAGAALSAALLVVVGLDTGAWGALAPYGLEILLTVALGYATKRHSQLAAGALLALYVGTKVVQWVTLGRPAGLLFAAVFGYFYFQGLRGAIDYAELRATEPEPPDPYWFNPSNPGLPPASMRGGDEQAPRPGV